MPLNALPKPTPSPNSIAELALIGSLSAGSLPAVSQEGSHIGLRQFWAANLSLQQRWLKELASVSTDATSDAERFERIALELFLMELLTRVWATHWTIGDRAAGAHDIERVLANTLRGLSQVRREVLLLMVRNWRGAMSETISRLDRFRRRCERWTDVLIAGPGARHGVWDFAVEVDRAQDFGMDHLHGPGRSVNPASLLVSAGLRVMFGTTWPPGCCCDSPFPELIDRKSVV